MRDGNTKWQTFSWHYCKDECERGQREQQERWTHRPFGVCVGVCFFVFSLCGYSLSLFCNYPQAMQQEVRSTVVQETPYGTAGDKYSCCVLGLSDQA